MKVGLSGTMFVGFTALAAAAIAQPSVKSAPPMNALFEEWRDAFNAGDPARIKDYYAARNDDPNPMFALESAEDSCGVTLEKVVEGSDKATTLLLRQKCLPGLLRLKLERADADPAKLKTVDLRPLPLPGTGAVEAVASIAQRLTARDAFAGAVIVRRGKERLLAQSWGIADRSDNRAVTLDTPMFLASAGKMFTAVAMLQLVEEGKVELDAPLGRYLTDYPNAAMAKVTIRQLLTHRGGTGDIGILERAEGANRAKIRTIADMIGLNGDRAPAFPPGSKDDYSNYGFILLGAVIEKVTGEAYQDLVGRRIFAPAGMTASAFPDRDHLQGVAVGYTTYFGEEKALRPNLDSLPWQGASAGGGVASANDMLRFFDALRTGKLLGPAMLKLATTAGATSWYGLGFVVNPDTPPSWGHGGTSYGMDVATHHYPSVDTTFICLGARDMVCNRLIFAWYLRTFPPQD